MSTRSKTGLVSLAVTVVLGAAWLWLGMRSQPQLPPSDEVLNAVDGLFTAVTARDQARLAACQQRLQAIHAAGDLPEAAWKRLQGVITMSERGDWEPAARRLYHFIQGQRREGVSSQGRSQLTAA